MPQYDANLSMLFTHLPFAKRVEAAARAGFEAIEFMWPSEAELDGLTMQQLADSIKTAGLGVVLINFDQGEIARGYRGLTGVRAETERFRANVPHAVEVAHELGCAKLNAMAGNVVDLDRREDGIACLTENLAFACDAASQAGIEVMLEALNPVEFPDYLVHDSATAMSVISQADRPNLRFQLDVYHVAMAGEAPLRVIHSTARKIGHVQFADYPGRHEPGTGELAWSDILESLDRHRYRGWIGLEYKPTNPAAMDFGYLESIGGHLGKD